MIDRNRPESRLAAGIAAVAAAQRGVFRALTMLGVLIASLLSPSTGWSQVAAPASPTITTFAGTGADVYLGDGGPAINAGMGGPSAVATDLLGNLYIADAIYNVVRKVTPDGIINTIAGDVSISSYSGDGGLATSAGICEPTGVAVDTQGNVFIVDSLCHNVRKVSPDGYISTVAGTGNRGYTGDGGPATAATLARPNGIAVDVTGNLYIADDLNYVVRKVATDGTISTVAGNHTYGVSGDGGAATDAQMQDPFGVAVDSAGDLFIADLTGSVVREVTPDGVIHTVAGTYYGPPSGDGGPATSATLGTPYAVAVDSVGNLYIADILDNVVRRVTGGIITTIAGNGTAGFSGDGGPATSAQLSNPWGLAVDTGGNLYIADEQNHVVREVDTGAFLPHADKPVFDTAPGKVTFGQTVTITDTTADAAIYYTTDGSTPTIASNVYYGPVPVYQTEIIYAIAIAPGKLPSEVASAAYAVPLDPKVMWPNPQAITYGTPITAVQENATADVPGTFSYSPAVGTILAVGYHAINVTFTPNDTLQFLSVTRSVSILVTSGTPPASPIITTIAGTGASGYSGDGGPATGAQLLNPLGLARDSSGNLYIADQGNSVVRKLANDGTIVTVAGNGTYGYSGDGGPATGAQLGSPFGIAVDSSDNLYIADCASHAVRKVTRDGIISTYAGNGGSYPGDNGPATSARLSCPSALAVDKSDNLYISDGGERVIRKVTSGGIISTVAGSGNYGYSGDGGLATDAEIGTPAGIAVDASGNLYIADYDNHVIRKVDRLGIISTVAGNGTLGYSGDGGAAVSAQLRNCREVAVDPDGNLYIGDSFNYVIRKVDSNGIITTVAGNGTPGFSGDGGPATSAQLSFATGIVLDGAGDIYLSDATNERIRRIGSEALTPAATPVFDPPAGKVAVGQTVTITDTTSGATVYYTTDGSTPTVASTVYGGPVTVYQTQTIQAIAIAPGSLPSSVASATYVIPVNPTIVWPNPAPIAHGNQLTSTQLNATANVPGTFSYLPASGTVLAVGYHALSVTFTPSDTLNYNPITRSVGILVTQGTPPASPIITTIAGNGIAGYTGDGGPAIAAELNHPQGVAVDSSGNLYVADFVNLVIRKVTPAGVISTVAGNGTSGYSGDGGPATSAQFATPGGIAVDSSGNLFIADSFNYVVRKVTPAGIISTVAGNHVSGASNTSTPSPGDGGPATNAEFTYPIAVAVDGFNNLYISDYFARVVRKVNGAGIISTIAGNGTVAYSGDGGPATSAGIPLPSGLAVDATGNLYITDGYDSVIRKVNPGGVISTFAGNGKPGYSGDGGPATSAQLAGSGSDIAIDSAGNLYISDGQNSVVRKVNGSGIITTVAGNGTYGYSGDGGPATSAQLSYSSGLASDAAGNLYIGDYYNFCVRRVGSGPLAPAATPVFNPPGGAYTGTQNIAINDTIPSATIYFTTNGDTPTASSTKYTGAITVSATETIKAIAIANGYSRSAVATATYAINLSQAITFPPLANVSYGVAPIALSASASSGLPVSYSVVGPAGLSGPTLAITGAGNVTVTATQAGNSQYAAATAVSRSFTVGKAVLTARAASLSRPYGVQNPALTYAISGFVNADTASVVSGTATLSTTATLKSPQGVYPVTFATQDLAAVNYTFTYAAGTLTVLAPLTVAAPAFSPEGGTFTARQSVKITDATAGAAIHFTLDGSEPTASSPVYASPIEVGSTETIRAVAILNGVSSTISSATYTINLPQCQTLDYSKGFTASGLTLNGGATITDKLLQLTDGGPIEARTAFSSVTLPVAEFSTDFTFQILNPVADGLTFTIQSSSPKAVGGIGGRLGYAGIHKSVAFKLDIHNNAGEGNNSTGVYINGASPTTPSINLTPAHIDLHSGHVFAVHLRYLNGRATGTIRDTVTGASGTATFLADIVAAAGANAYVGFTASTGGRSATQNILTWSFSGGAGCSRR